jgi:hypothetical protein
MTRAKVDIEETARRWHEAHSNSARLVREHQRLIAARTLLAERGSEIVLDFVALGRSFVSKLVR